MKVILIICMMALMGCSAEKCETKFVEGEHYTKVGERISEKPEVREYFSFYCPHCFRFEPLMAGVKKQLPDGVSFERNHVDFLRGAPQKTQQLLTKGLVIAKQLGMENEMAAAIFNYIHVQNAEFGSEKDLRNVFVINGGDGAQFDNLMKSQDVQEQADLLKQNQESMSANRALSSVPTVIVSGKYRINNQALEHEDMEQEYNKLIKYLVSLDE